MITYRFRLKFFVHTSGVIHHDERTLDFLLPKDIRATLSCLDGKSISEGQQLVLSGGGFTSKEDAANVGKQLKDSLLLGGVKSRIGIDVGKDTAISTMGPDVKNNIFDKYGVKFIDDVHGLMIYSEEHPVQISSVSSPTLYSPANAEKFTNLVSALFCANPVLSDKVRLSLELYGASHYETSSRARFITLVIATEALIEPRDRDVMTRKTVYGLIKQVMNSGLGGKEKDSLIGSLNWLYKQSISQALREMAERYLLDRQYANLIASKFISHCYDIRSKLVHKGNVDSDTVHIGALAAQVNIFLSDLLVEMVGIKSI
jgi:hypothetical protein